MLSGEVVVPYSRNLMDIYIIKGTKRAVVVNRFPGNMDQISGKLSGVVNRKYICNERTVGNM